MLINDKGEVLAPVSNPIDVRDLNEADVLTILEALRICFGSFHESLIVDSDSLNTSA